MDYTQLRTAYEALWKVLPQNVFSDLNKVWDEHKDEGNDFVTFFQGAVEYNPAAAAFFWYLNGENFPNAGNDILEKVNNQIQEMTEEVDVWEAAKLWEALILTWTDDNEEKVLELLEQLYAKATALTKDMDWGQKKRIVDKVVDVFLTSMTEKKLPFPATATYIRTLYFLSKVLDERDLTGKEVYYDNALYMDKIDDYTKILTKRYVKFLYNNKRYRACSSFLHKTRNMDYEDIFGLREEEFWIEMLKTGSEHLAECLQRIKEYTSEEELKLWKEKIYLHVEDLDCLAWCDWLYYLYNLVHLLDKEETTEEEFMLQMQRELPFSQYPCEATSNIKRITGATQFIFSEIFRRDWDVLPVLKMWYTNNLYNYDRRKIVAVQGGPNVKFRDVRKKHDWALNYKNFMSHSYSPEERVMIFMNSPLRFEVEFRDFVAAIAKEAGNDRVEELFRSYRLDGFLSYTDHVSSARGRLRFELNARCLYTQYYFKNRYVEKNVDYYNSLLFLEEDWYRKHEEEIMTIKRDSRATFRIWGYGSLGRHEGVVLIHDVRDYETESVNPEEEMLRILDWIKETRKVGKYIPVGKDEFHYVYPLSKFRLSQIFAMEILETVHVLRKSPDDVMHFIGMINHGRLDKINEFQYILTHNEVRSFKAKNFDTFIRRVREMAYDICYEPALTPQHKCNIYMNTCLKTFFSLPEFWKKSQAKEDDMISFAWQNNELDHFMFLTQYKGAEGGNGVFEFPDRIKIQLPIRKGDHYVWKWEGKELSSENIGEPFRVTIKDIDTNAQIIWIREVYPREIEESWSMLIRSLMDLKLDPSMTYVESIRSYIEDLDMDYFVKNRVIQLANVFQGLFERAGRDEFSEEYNLFWCTQILKVFGEGKNPFAQKERLEENRTMTPEEIKRLQKGCHSFLRERIEELKEDTNSFSKRGLEEFFELSPYQLVYSKEEFFAIAKEYYEQTQDVM